MLATTEVAIPCCEVGLAFRVKEGNVISPCLAERLHHILYLLRRHGYHDVADFTAADDSRFHFFDDGTNRLVELPQVPFCCRCGVLSCLVPLDVHKDDVDAGRAL